MRRRRRTAAETPGSTRRIRDLYVGLHELGHAHSVEVWDGDDLAGGLYGVSLGRAFFGESMFHRSRDASKVALVHLVARLIAGGFVLLDTQFVTDHLRSFGAVEVTRRRYRALLDQAIAGDDADFSALPVDRPISGAEALGIIAESRLIPSIFKRSMHPDPIRRYCRKILNNPPDCGGGGGGGGGGCCCCVCCCGGGGRGTAGPALAARRAFARAAEVPPWAPSADRAPR